MRRASGVSVWGAVFVVSASGVLFLLLLAPVGAQDTTMMVGTTMMMGEKPTDDDTMEPPDPPRDRPERGDVDEPEDVIKKQIPDKPLPKTGGFTLLLGAGTLLAGATLVSVGILRR